MAGPGDSQSTPAAPPYFNPIEIIDIQMSTEMTPELRRRNIRTAWLLAGFAGFMFLTSIPFWKGLANMIAASGL